MLTPALSLIAAPLLVSTVAAEPTQWLSSFLTAAEQQAHKILGLHACPAPFLLPESCINGASPDFPGLDGCCTNVPGGFLLRESASCSVNIPFRLTRKNPELRRDAVLGYGS